jgi:hypothetical protein
MNLVRTSQKTTHFLWKGQSVYVQGKTCCLDHTDALCWQNAGLLNVTAGGKHGNHFD